MKTSELQGAALDWAVAKCEGKDDDIEICAGNLLYGRVTSGFVYFKPSTDWAQGGAIIEREGVAIGRTNGVWYAFKDENDDDGVRGETPLIAAMRCYVASKLGDEIEVPEGV